MDLLAAVPAGTNAKKDPVFLCFEHCRLAGKLTPFLAYALRLAKDKESHERREQIAHGVGEIHMTVDRNYTPAAEVQTRDSRRIPLPSRPSILGARIWSETFPLKCRAARC